MPPTDSQKISCLMQAVDYIESYALSKEHQHQRSELLDMQRPLRQKSLLVLAYSSGFPPLQYFLIPRKPKFLGSPAM